MSSIVYIIRAGETDRVKIGVTASIAARMRTLRTSSPEPLVLLRAIPGGTAVERWMHRQFSELRLEGEWFRFDEAMLVIEPGSVKPLALRKKKANSAHSDVQAEQCETMKKYIEAGCEAAKRCGLYGVEADLWIADRVGITERRVVAIRHQEVFRLWADELQNAREWFVGHMKSEVVRLAQELAAAEGVVAILAAEDARQASMYERMAAINAMRAEQESWPDWQEVMGAPQ